LQKGNDGLWYGYAQWPNSEQRSKSNIHNTKIDEARTKMRAAILESLPEIELHPVADYLVLENQ
jgi:hypothetical protein